MYIYIYTLAYIYAHKRARIPPQISCCDIEGNFFWRMGPYPINCTVFGIWPNLVAYLPHFQITHSVYRFWLKSFMNSQVTSMFVPSISSVLSILQYIVYMDLYPTHKPTSGKRTKPIHTHIYIYIDRNRYKDKYQHKYRYIQIISRVKPPPSSKKKQGYVIPGSVVRFFLRGVATCRSPRLCDLGVRLQNTRSVALRQHRGLEPGGGVGG